MKKALVAVLGWCCEYQHWKLVGCAMKELKLGALFFIRMQPALSDLPAPRPLNDWISSKEKCLRMWKNNVYGDCVFAECLGVKP